jgi:hypothetical protein
MCEKEQTSEDTEFLLLSLDAPPLMYPPDLQIAKDTHANPHAKYSEKLIVCFIYLKKFFL